MLAFLIAAAFRFTMGPLILIALQVAYAKLDTSCDPTRIGIDLRSCPLKSINASEDSVELHLMPMHLQTVHHSFMTRAYSGRDRIPTIPGPIIYMRQNSQVELTLFNDLGDKQTPKGSQINGFFEYNTSNIHTHGLHVSSEEPQDDVAIRIGPGYSYRYQYDISDHCSGLLMYHAHCHGSVAMQVGGGAFGLLIVEDEHSNSPFAFLKTLPELMISIWQFPAASLTMFADDGDLFRQISGDFIPNLILINGFVQPKITMNPSQWYRWRIIHSSIESDIKVSLNGCSLVLLALDGIWLSTPRRVSSVRLLQASRAELAVSCPARGTFKLTSSVSKEHLAVVDITDISQIGPRNLDLSLYVVPRRPPYLRDTVSLPAEMFSNRTFSLEIQSPHPDGRLNGRLFSGDTRDQALHIMSPDTIEQWTLDINEHPFHIHTFPFQIQDDSADGFYKKGDWIDTYEGPKIAIRFNIGSEFNGKVPIHCHLAQHSDMGILGIAWIDGHSRSRKQSLKRILYRPNSALTIISVNSLLLCMAIWIIFRTIHHQ